MSFGKALKTIMPLVAALALAAAPAKAASCPPDKAVYLFGFNGARTNYTEGNSDSGNRVKFETSREDKPVWSVEGEIYCDDIVILCTLQLDRPAGAKERSDADNDDNPDGCSKFILAVTEIYDGNGGEFGTGKIAYIAFGGVAAFAIACRNVIDLRILDKTRLSDGEREGIFIMPPYVRFSSCGR